jgi:hypothetical protein
MRKVLVLWAVGLVGLAGCPGPRDEVEPPVPVSDESIQAPAAEPAGTADAAAVEAAKAMLDGLGTGAVYKLSPGGVMTEVIITDGAALSPEDITLLGQLTDLQVLQIRDYRQLNDQMAGQLAGLPNLTSLALTNTVIGDPTVTMIVQSFPKLTELDLSSNTNMTNGAMKIISQLSDLQRLILVQTRFNDLGTMHLSKLANLRVLDLRGNMEAGNITLKTVGELPNLVAFKHRSTAVSDYGMENLAQSKTLRSLLMQDFAVTDMSGEQLAKIDTLTELEVFRCQGFGSQGVLALKGADLTRLKLRDLPMVDDQATEVFTELPTLVRLELHELPSVSDYGLENLAALQSLEMLDIWALPQMGDPTLEVIAKLPNLKVLSIRETAITDAGLDRLLAMPKLESLVLKDNGSLTSEGLEKLKAREWTNLDIDQ